MDIVITWRRSTKNKTRNGEEEAAPHSRKVQIFVSVALNGWKTEHKKKTKIRSECRLRRTSIFMCWYCVSSSSSCRPVARVRMRRVEKTAPTSINTNVKLFQSQFYPWTNCTGQESIPFGSGFCSSQPVAHWSKILLSSAVCRRFDVVVGISS